MSAMMTMEPGLRPCHIRTKCSRCRAVVGKGDPVCRGKGPILCPRCGPASAVVCESPELAGKSPTFVDSTASGSAIAPVPAHLPPSHAHSRQSLPERYRPASIEQIWGQPGVTELLSAFVADPYPAAFLFTGDTGTGKTSAAVALAGALGCDIEHGEFGGVYVIAAGDQTADAVRATWDKLLYTTWTGSGWRVLIINEADRMLRPAENVWLDRLEDIPAKTVVVFSTNEPQRLSRRFMDRCTVARFESDALLMRPAAMQYIRTIWRAESGVELSEAAADSLFESCVVDGKFSFRRAITAIQRQLLTRKNAA